MLKNIINTFFTRIFASVANLVIAIVISHMYGATLKGEQGLILTTINLITLITAIIGSGSLIYFTPRVKTGHLLVPSYLWNLVVCLGVFIILSQTDMIAGEYVLHTLVLAFILTATHIHTGILVGIEKIKQSNFAFLMNTLFVLLSLLFFVFVMQVQTVFAYIYSLYVGYGIHFLISLALILRNWASGFRGIEPENSSLIRALLGLVRFGFLNQLDVIAQMLSFRLSYYFINYYFSKSAVGIYSNAISIIESVWLISRSIAMVQVARIVNTSDLKYSLTITIKLLKISFCIVLLALIMLLLIPSSFYQFLFGQEFGGVRQVIFSISPGVLLFSTSFILSGLFSGTGKYVYNTLASMAGLGVTVGLAFILIPRYGLTGAGITASLSYLVSVGVKFFILFTRYDVSINDFKIGRTDFRDFFQLLKNGKT